jgi:hypothetical protein
MGGWLLGMLLAVTFAAAFSPLFTSHIVSAQCMTLGFHMLFLDFCKSVP